MSQSPISIPNDLRTVAQTFATQGYQCWLVGGAVRDGLLGLSSDDFDLATDAKPQDVISMFHRTVPTGIKHGTVTVLLGNHHFETTTFRQDGKYSDGRRPDEVVYSSDIIEDLARRDFTINAIAWDLINHQLLDPHNGRLDLTNRIIKAIGVPEERLKEDSLRSVRACRLASQLGFKVDKNTLKAIRCTLAGIPDLSAERVWEEMKKILLSPQPSTAFRLFKETGLLNILLPELAACVGGSPQGGPDVFEHCLLVCDMSPRESPMVRAAALFHDIGKPASKHQDTRHELVFHQHELVGADITLKILERYKASNAEKDCIVRLVRHHMIHYTQDWTDAHVRRFMVRIGLDILDDLLALRIAHSSAISPGPQSATPHLEELISRIEGILKSNFALSIRDLVVNGRDIMEALAIKPSPQLGDLLNHLLDCVLEDPEVNERGRLLDEARRWWALHYR